MTRLGRVLVAALIGASAAACAGGSRSFSADGRLQITSPTPMAVVAVPFTVAWTSGRSGDHGYAVFVDQDPVPPGHGLRDLADDQCKHQPGCPNPTYLADHGVYTTTTDSVEVETLPAVAGLAGRARHPLHTITIVALDVNGRRRGDAAWTSELRE